MNEEKNSGKILLIGVIMIVLILAVFFSIRFFYHPEPQIETFTSLKGTEFTYLAGLWNTDWAVGNKIYSLHFHYNPEHTYNISVQGKLNSSEFNKGFVYITFDPYGEDLEYVRLALMELSLNLNKALGVIPKAACTKMAPACENITIMDCEHATEPLIELSSKPGTLINLDDNCVLLQGEKAELVRNADRLLFQWFGFI